MRKIVVLLALASVVGVLLLQAGTASANPAKTTQCNQCHNTVAVQVSIAPASGTTFSYTITGPNAVYGWAVFNTAGSNVLNGLGAASGTIDMIGQPAGSYTFWGVNTPGGTSSSGSSSKPFTYTPPATNTPTPTAAATSTPRPTNTPLPTNTPAATNTPTATPTTPMPTNTPVPTNTPLPTSTAVPTSTSVPTNTPAPTNTPMPTNTPAPTNTPMPTNTPAPTNTPVPTVTSTPTPPPASGGNVTWRGKSWMLVGTITAIDGDTWTVDGVQIRVDDSTRVKGGNPKVDDEIVARGKGSPGDPLVASSVAILKGDSGSSHYGVGYFGGHEREDD